MEETQTYEVNTGVEETPPAAGEEYTEATTGDMTTGEQQAEPGEVSGEETGEEEPAAAGQEETEDQEEEAAPLQDEKVEQAFAKRLAKEREKLEQQFYQQYGPVLQLAQLEAQKYGIQDPNQWAQAVLQSYEQQYYQQLQEQGIDPRLVEQHPAVLRARQYEQQLRQKESQLTEKERLQQEMGEFIEHFPDLDVKSIPAQTWAEVEKLRSEKGLSILDAFLRVNYRKLAEQARVKGEQAAIAARRKKRKASTGSAKGGIKAQKSAWDIPRDSFEQLIEKAKRGELKNF